jgi:hypothetical protein
MADIAGIRVHVIHRILPAGAAARRQEEDTEKEDGSLHRELFSTKIMHPPLFCLNLRIKAG